MKHITILFDTNGIAVAAHENPDMVKSYKAQLLKDHPDSEYFPEEWSMKKLRKIGGCIDDLYLVQVGSNVVPSKHVKAYETITGDTLNAYRSAVDALYMIAETTDKKLKPKDIDALARSIYLVEQEIESIEGEPISRDTLDEITQELREFNRKVAED